MFKINVQFFGGRGSASATGDDGTAKQINNVSERLKAFEYMDVMSLSEELDKLPDGIKLYTGQTHYSLEGSRDVFWEKEGNYWNYLGTGSGYGAKNSYNLLDEELIKIQSNQKYNPRFVR